MRVNLSQCEKDASAIQVCYLVTAVLSSLIALVALGSSHWVELEEGISQADIIANTRTESYDEDSEYDFEVECIQDPCPTVEVDAEPPGMMYIYSNIGLWRVCFRTADIPVKCNEIDYITQSWDTARNEGGEVTTYITRGVRRAAFTSLLGVISLLLGTVFGIISLVNLRPIFGITATILKMASAMFLFLTIIIFLAGIQNEASMAPLKEDDEGNPLFSYFYGWSFHVLVVSYLGSNMASVLSITLYIQRFRKTGQMYRAEPETSTEGDLIYANDNSSSEMPPKHNSLSEVMMSSRSQMSIRNEVSV